MSYEDLPCQQAVELVTDYLEVALNVEQLAALERHLAWCEWCATYGSARPADRGRQVSVRPRRSCSHRAWRARSARKWCWYAAPRRLPDPASPATAAAM